MAGGPRASRRQPRRSSRARPRGISYQEDPSSSDSVIYDSSTDYTLPPEARTRLRRKSALFNGRVGRPSSNKRQATSTSLEASSNKKPRKAEPNKQGPGPWDAKDVVEDGKIPAWHTLPYHILVQVFQYAVRPESQTRPLPRSSIHWLLGTSRLCKTFAEPAITVLYYSPPLESPSRAYRLLSHLQAQDDNSMFNYRAKIRYLSIEPSLLSRKYQGHGWVLLELRMTLSYLPLLALEGMPRG